MNWIAFSTGADEDEDDDEDALLPASEEVTADIAEAGVETAEIWLDGAIDVTVGSDKVPDADSDAVCKLLTESEAGRLSPKDDPAMDEELPIDATPHDDKAKTKARKMISDVFFMIQPAFQVDLLNYFLFYLYRRFKKPI